MRLVKGWKTIAFNISAIAIIQWSDVEKVISGLDWLDDKIAVQLLLVTNVFLRLITTSAVWEMWKDKNVSENTTK
tara:strand:+ start:6260 stop:6484 length:225 start_codon:yes stop_codon:yes gene_type:complete